MKLDELAALMGKSKQELEEFLKKNDVLELKLTEKNRKQEKDNGDLEVL